MMLVQQMSQPPAAPPPRPDLHAILNDEAPPSVLQLSKNQWAGSRSHSTTPSATGTTTPAKPIPIPTSANTRTSTSTTRKATFTIRPATPADAPQIRAIGASVFSSTFGFSIPPADLNAYIASSYALAAIQAELSSPSHHFVVAHPPSSPSTVLGFAQLTEHTTDPCLAHLPAAAVCELQRLYVRPECHGRGVGRALTAAVQSAAREKGYGYMWVGVWEGNFVAQDVYERAGFARVGEHEFTMGRCVQIDWIMVTEL